MKRVHFTLLSDGSSDRALVPILRWVLIQHLPDRPIQDAWADLRRLRVPPQGLIARTRAALKLYPCDILFIHRAAEGEPRKVRIDEILRALEAAKLPDTVTRVAVVPVRMSEAWLLIDKAAIRRAAENPHGRERLALPATRRLDTLPDPKAVLHELLRSACGLTGRRLKRFDAAAKVHRVAEFVEDYAALRRLEAFQALEADVHAVCKAIARSSDE
jgi:hypothetical protein